MCYDNDVMCYGTVMMVTAVMDDRRVEARIIKSKCLCFGNE